MKIESAEFVKSVKQINQLPGGNYPEIAFIGRSNVGKSSLMNQLMGKTLARTSNTPGKTREINYFFINNKFYFVDLPGYGYAKVSKTEQDEWKKLIEEFLKTRIELKLICLLIDSRHPSLESDIQMHNFLKFFGRRFSVIRTKADKLNQSEKAKSKKVSESLFDGYEFMQDFSAHNGLGKRELLLNISRFLEF
ncbi:MAG: ribosome biogenesis GTP-binding protein YihA/YsxC [Chloroherpetonaceae bacterium]|nr:ribosome biogenesis GTP-binding protein YihA/YsxC [Chloroherpetonaceae bacterium]